ncbi:hypothetical protein SPBRAN_1272 [uncultured Candidatus Thioglobus sp.]|nr:hypothetical protein SPBRAN_1272 [uncultured Candidatus Thioglobus sp.]
MKSLQELSREYSRNIIDQKTYREARGKLIQAICANEIEVIDKTYLPPLDILATPNPSQTSDESLPKNSTTENSQVQETSSSSSKNYILLFSIIVFLCFIVFIIPFKFTSENNRKAQDLIVATAIPPWKTLITQFLQQKNWQKPHMDTFIESWENDLTETDMLVASTSPEMKRLANAIYQRLLDKRALLSLDEYADIVTDQQKLIDFAEKLQIDDERLFVIEKPNQL